ncbi:MAG: M23 family metallopeptidase [Solirubrobacterales bacterium]|nr:M23 family metallopeptidase [Solirubrobacterales bacterium]
MRIRRTNTPNPQAAAHRGPTAHVAASLALLVVAAVFAFTPASTLASSLSPTAHAAVVAHAAEDTSGGTGPGDTPPPVVGVPAMDAATGWVFPVKEAHQMVGPSSWSLDQGVDLGFGAGFSRSFCGAKANLVAVADGVITQVGISGFGGQSPVMKITSGKYKNRYIYYGHSQPTIVKKGQVVKRGQIISHIGCGIVGISSAPHLEFGMYGPGATYCCPSRGATSHGVLSILKRMFPTAVASARRKK